MKIPLPTSEIIKRRLFRAREHLQSLAGTSPVHVLSEVVHTTYEFNRALKLPAVRHETYSSVTRATGDAIQNLTTVIDFDLTQLEIDSDRLDESVIAAQHLMQAIQSIPLPSAPPPRYP